MNYNQDLYQQFVERKTSNNSSQSFSQAYRRRAILQKFWDLQDKCSLTLESSIPLLRCLGIISRIDSVDHIVQLMQVKKNISQGWQGAQNELWECRLIFFLWDVIARDTVDMREFKELIILLLNNESDRAQSIEDIFGQNDQIQQLIQTWDHLFVDVEPETASYSKNVEEISDISIIKTKNVSVTPDNQENNATLNNQGYHTDRHRSQVNRYKNAHSRHKSILEKSRAQKTAKTALEKSGSMEHITSKRSDFNSLTEYISSGPSRTPAHFFGEVDSLTVDEQKRLVDRLYHTNKYQQREQQKKQLQEQKLKCQLKKCTFKPQISKKATLETTSKDHQRNIKGYRQAIERMKSGYRKQKQLKQNLELRRWKRSFTVTSQPTIAQEPNFHVRPDRQVKNELFELKFTLGRLTIPIKIKESDRVPDLVANIGRIYSLKEYEKSYIHDSIMQTLEEYSQVFGRPAQFETDNQ